MFLLGWAKCREKLGNERDHSPARGKAPELTHGEKFPLQLKKAAFAGAGLTFYAPISCSNETLYGESLKGQALTCSHPVVFGWPPCGPRGVGGQLNSGNVCVSLCLFVCYTRERYCSRTIPGWKQLGHISNDINIGLTDPIKLGS